MNKLLYVGQQVADDLKKKIGEHLERYRTGDFLDMEAGGDWRIPLSLDGNLAELGVLKADGGAEAEILNSLTVGHALVKLTPTLARENRLWIRLSHIECLEYSRDRWLPATLDDEDAIASIAKHFFAPTLTGCRDDHSVSRLWWNYHIAKQIMPENPARALKMMLARADIRLNFLERPGIAARPALGRGIIRALENSVALLNGQEFFRAFMRRVNLRGAGIAFEVWDDTRVDEFMTGCIDQAEGEMKGAANPGKP
ncbi:DUF6339 family protein [Luteimonas notoginsengisoli]|uniref:DUF6339 family protein n=1 Tax=Luteimonas notoginsengisoli TaxID=1578200 RepID=A0ABV7UTN0_9GAMM